MKKTILIIFTLLLCVAMAGFVACGGKGDDSKQPSVDPSKSNFSGITFLNSTMTYDGEPHTIEVKGVPEFAKTEYSNEGPYENVGTYAISVKISAEGYNDLTLNATLTIIKATYDMANAKWDYTNAFNYDGQEKEVKVTGLPQGVSVVSYTNNKKTNAGSYTATVELDYDKTNYNAVSIPSCSWKINKATMTGITFSNKTFEYDGLTHSIEIVGNVSSSATVVYTSNVSGITNSAINVGEYNITATITDNNFETLILNAVLKITSNDDERYLAVSGNTLFFQNAIDNNRFYAYNFSDGSPVLISGDNAVDIISLGSDKVMFISKSLFLSAVKTAEYNTISHKVSVENVLSDSVRYVQYESSNIIYYVVNGLTKAKSGIFKADLSGQEPTITCLSVGKAKFLQLYNNKLYFADAENDNKLSCINTTTANQSRSVIVDRKIKTLTQKNGTLYYTVNNLLGDYIAKCSVNGSNEVKLTSDAGIDLMIVGNDLYYINVDKFSTAILGDGIYKTSINKSFDNNLSGTKVIDGGTYGVCSLTAYDNYLYYYDVNGYKLIQYSINTQVKKNLLDGFVKPEDPTPLSFGSQLKEKDGILYYLDVWDGKTLHSYNPQTKANTRLTANKVDNFAIIDDYIYFNSVSFITNNDLYRINIKSGGDKELVNKYDAQDMVSDGTYIYYIECNVGGMATAIHKAQLDGTEDTVIYTKGVSNLKLINGKLLFIDGYQIYELNLATNMVSEIKVENSSVHTTVFETDGIYIYYRDMHGIGWTSKRLSRCRIDGSEKVVLIDDADPIKIEKVGNNIYYYSDTISSSKNGLFKVSANLSPTGSGTKILGTNEKYAMQFCITSSGIYFIDYKLDGALGDSHIYFMSLSGGNIQKIA